MPEKRKNSWSPWSQSGGGKGEELWRNQFENCMTEYIINSKVKLGVISCVGIYIQ